MVKIKLSPLQNSTRFGSLISDSCCGHLTAIKVPLVFTADGIRWEPEAGEEDDDYFFSPILLFTYPIGDRWMDSEDVTTRYQIYQL